MTRVSANLIFEQVSHIVGGSVALPAGGRSLQVLASHRQHPVRADDENEFHRLVRAEVLDETRHVAGLGLARSRRAIRPSPRATSRSTP